MPTHTGFRLAAACVLFACSLPAFAQDRVFPTREAPVSGKITELNTEQVKIVVRSKEQVYDLSDVKKITFDGEPRELDRAREQILLEQYDQALEEIKKIAIADIQNPLVRQDVEFYRYYCEGRLGLAGSGDKKLARDGLYRFAQSNSQTQHLFPLSELLGELAMALGDNAKPYFGKLLSAPDSQTKAKGEYWLGEIELAAGNTKTARDYFGKLAAAQSNTPEMTRLKTFAELGLTRCELQDGKSKEALKQLDKMIDKNDSTDQELFAKLNNAKGACYESLGQPRQALLRYLQTDTLFFTDPQAHAEALYHLAKLWPQAGEAARAAEAKARLVQLYASSAWANKE